MDFNPAAALGLECNILGHYRRRGRPWGSAVVRLTVTARTSGAQCDYQSYEAECKAQRVCTRECVWNGLDAL